MWHLWWLTFELSGRRQDARPGPVKMNRVPPVRARWRAVCAQLEQSVWRHSSQADFPQGQDLVPADEAKGAVHSRRELGYLVVLRNSE